MSADKITKSFIEERLREKAKSRVSKDLDNLSKLIGDNPIGKELTTDLEVRYLIKHNVKSSFKPFGIEKVIKILEERYFKQFSDELIDRINDYNDFLNIKND